jgi:hypothetical protein
MGVLGDDEAVGEEEHPIGLGGRAGVVGDHHDGATEVARRVAQQSEHLGRRAGVEVASRLVREHDGRLGDERAGDRDALLLTAGELGGAVALAVGEADAIDEVGDAALRGGVRASGETDREGDVLLCGERREQVEALEDEADAIPASRCLRVDWPAPEGPMTATISPASMARSTPRSASTAVAPWP